MNSLNYFDNREDCKKFLDSFNFEYFIPYFHDWIGYNRYTVQLNEECTKVVYCSLDSVEDGLVKDSFPFFDIERLKVKNKEGILVNAFQLAQAGESLRRYVKGKRYLAE
ncbi:hypothetical protein [Clostridium magnum]|uniref:Uncharacterized protein n=1 Tax=Clostridium magnum DSM 2767 TaxID=1121326 RepID=A0A162SMX3_9CLOT|nr:hypothetical protein [Clostridium magnum]KZL91637.1 hypothetical protein CLMAG_33960 [Clostridium magnum DSM 2767]SHH50475.1 hypothetical protein SAMN02745944_00835 [Clostridium magnum DSM 2767]